MPEDRSDGPRNEEHAQAGREAVVAGLALVLPARDDHVEPEDREDGRPGALRELREDGREERQGELRLLRDDLRLRGDPRLVERALAQAAEPAMKRARVDGEVLGNGAERGAARQVPRRCTLDDAGGIQLPRSEIRGEHASVATAPRLTAAGDRHEPSRYRTLSL